jgi:hypothetical protein
LAVKTPWAQAWLIGQRAQATDQHRHLRRGERQELRLVEQAFLGRHAARLEVVAEAVGDGFEHGEGNDVGLFLRGIGAAGGEGHRDGMAARLGGLLDRGAAAEHDQVGERDLSCRPR